MSSDVAEWSYTWLGDTNGAGGYNSCRDVGKRERRRISRSAVWMQHPGKVSFSFISLIAEYDMYRTFMSFFRPRISKQWTPESRWTIFDISETGSYLQLGTVIPPATITLTLCWLQNHCIFSMRAWNSVYILCSYKALDTAAKRTWKVEYTEVKQLLRMGALAGIYFLGMNLDRRTDTGVRSTK
jgi:hypothetical protein